MANDSYCINNLSDEFAAAVEDKNIRDLFEQARKYNSYDDDVVQVRPVAYFGIVQDKDGKVTDRRVFQVMLEFTSPEFGTSNAKVSWKDLKLGGPNDESVCSITAAELMEGAKAAAREAGLRRGVMPKNTAEKFKNQYGALPQKQQQKAKPATPTYRSPIRSAAPAEPAALAE
jgi:hypothetical protein